jgi:hypothetical protein
MPSIAAMTLAQRAELHAIDAELIGVADQVVRSQAIADDAQARATAYADRETALEAARAALLAS